MAIILCNPLDLWPLESVAEREKLAVFGVLVANKDAAQTWDKAQRLFVHDERPFATLRRLERQGELYDKLLELKVGQYTRVFKTLRHFAGLPESWAWQDLQKGPGNLLKTARLVGMYTRPPARVAVLDIHVLAFLRQEFPHCRVPKDTPSRLGEYLVLEHFFLKSADRRGLEPWQLDREVWRGRRGRRFQPRD